MNKDISIVLDTNMLVNPDSRRFFGPSPDQALDNLLKSLKNKPQISCFMPPSVYEELLKFIENPIAESLSIFIKKQPPNSYQGQIPALLMYEFIEEMRNRMNKGLRVSEKFSRRGLKGGDEQKLIQDLREEFRIAMREGIIDSKEDFDLILLAKELKAQLASSDQGLIKWAAKLGIPCLTAEELSQILK